MLYTWWGFVFNHAKGNMPKAKKDGYTLAAKKRAKKKKPPRVKPGPYTPSVGCVDICVGFDVSSTTVGWSAIHILGGKIIKVEYSYYKPEDKQEDPLKSIVALYNFVVNLINDIVKKGPPFSMIHVCVEDFLLFMKGKSSARTITVLSVYNRTVCLAVNQAWGENPILLPVATIRSSLKKMSGSTVRIDKEHVPETVEKIIGDHSLTPWKFRWLTNRNNSPIEECFDMADGLAAGLAGAFELKLIRS